MIDDIIKHARDREYMGGVDRAVERVKATGEVFTPTELVNDVLDQLPQEDFADPEKTFIDNSCGDGQFLSEVLIRKVEAGLDFEQALRTIYGVDLMPDNVELCRDRLLCGKEEYRHIVMQNIVCADAIRYHYRFDHTHPYSKTWQEYEQIIADRDAEIERRRKEKADDKSELGKKRATIRYRNEEIDKLKQRNRELEEQLKQQDIKKDIIANNGLEVLTGD